MPALRFPDVARMGRRLPPVALLLLSLLAAPARAAEPPFVGPVEAGLMQEPRNREASGLAASHATPPLLWTHADSGDRAVIHALDERGELRGTVQLEGIKAVDWEDIASFRLGDEAWICIGDVGDNAARRPFIQLHFVREPAAARLSPVQPLLLQPEFTVQVSYEDGARDCESIAVDPRERMVYLLSKREPVPRLYRLPLPASAPGTTAVAQRVGEVPHIPQPNAAQRLIKSPANAYRASPCAMDFAPDGTGALVLSYGTLMYFPRATGETWAAALAREPVALAPHDLPQAEAAAFSADGRSIFVCSEETPRLLRYDRW